MDSHKAGGNSRGDGRGDSSRPPRRDGGSGDRRGKPSGTGRGKPSGERRGGRSDDRSRGSRQQGQGRPGGRPPQRRDDAPPKPRGPRIPDDVDTTELDPAVINELRTLPEDLRERVAGHLVTAENALAEEDTALAKAHATEAKRLAGRVACVREAMGIVAYRCGDYADALAELRAVRRMTGDDSFLPMMADCERGLGRPERALELLRDARGLPPEARVEAAIVAAGARADMGQGEAALLLLDIPERKTLPPGEARARLEYAYAETLQSLGRTQEARDWFQAAADSDVDGVTDAAERVTD